MNVLVIEDNKRLQGVLRQALLEDGHQVTFSERGDEGRDLLLGFPFDIAVLDVMLPGLDGYSVLQQIRAGRCSVPVLMLTAKDTMPDIVRGLNLGADDYLTKPFQLQVFTARIRAVGRRAPAIQPDVISLGDIKLDIASHTVTRGSLQVALARKEFAILEVLMRRPNRVVTRDQIRQAAWPYDADVSDSSVDYYMHSLRSKLDTKGEDSWIRTVRSMGYTMASKK